MTGNVCSLKVRNLFCITSTLSSDRLLFVDLLSSLFSIVCSEQVKNITQSVLTFELISLFHFSKFYMLRGNPSMRNFVYDILLFLIPLWSKDTVMKLGTICPLMIVDSMSSPCSDNGLFLSSRRSYPADKCLYPKCLSIRADWVPFPQQGPPKMKPTVGLVAWVENPKNGLI